MRSWLHSGFSVDQSVFLPAGDQAGIERLIQYITITRNWRVLGGFKAAIATLKPPKP